MNDYDDRVRDVGCLFISGILLLSVGVGYIVSPGYGFITAGVTMLLIAAIWMVFGGK